MTVVTYKLEETVQNMKIRKLTKKPAIYRMTSDNKKIHAMFLKRKYILFHAKMMQLQACSVYQKQ